MPSRKEAMALGVPLSAYAAQSPVVVWPENRAAVEVFQQMQTQWLCAPMGGPSGLNYASLPVVMDCLGVENRPEVFRSLGWLERAALVVMHESKD